MGLQCSNFQKELFRHHSICSTTCHNSQNWGHFSVKKMQLWYTLTCITILQMKIHHCLYGLKNVRRSKLLLYRNKFYAIFMLLLLWSLLRNHFRGLWLEVLISSISDAMDGQRRTTRSKCQKSTRVPSNLALFGHFFFSEVRGYLK